MALYRDQGIVLRTMRLGESDRIVALLTQAHGKVRAVAKGVRKTKSRFGGRLEPFGHVDLLIYAGRGDLDIVSQAELITPFAELRGDYDAFGCAQTMCEGVDQVAPEREPNVRLVLLLLAGLRGAAGCVAEGRPVPQTMRAAFLLKLLGVSGFAPALRRCVHCGGGEGLEAFSIDGGGVVCCACRRPGDVRLAVESVALLQTLWTTPLADLPDAHTGEVDGLVRRTVEYHLERRLRSLTA